MTAGNLYGTTTATSNSVSVTGGSGSALGPDGNGVFSWNHTNGTSLQTVNAKWEDVSGTSNFDLECQGNQLRCKAGTAVNGRVYVYKNGQGADQCSKTRIPIGGIAGQGHTFLYINHRDSAIGYYIYIDASIVQLRRQGIFVHQFAHGINLSTTSAVFELRKVGSTLTVKVNSTTVHTYTDSTSINGGWPGLALESSTGIVTDARIDAWTDNASASL